MYLSAAVAAIPSGRPIPGVRPAPVTAKNLTARAVLLCEIEASFSFIERN